MLPPKNHNSARNYLTERKTHNWDYIVWAETELFEKVQVGQLFQNLFEWNQI